jgi:Multidrug resistance efflux pump
MNKKMKYIAAAIAVIVIAGLIIFLAARGKGKASKDGESFITKRGNVTHFTEQTGIIKAQVGAIVKVGTRATGVLTRLKYQVGDYVKKGELIATIDDRELLANKRNLEAQIEEQKRDLETKDAQYLYNKTNYEREERLLEKEFTTKDTVDKAKRELDVAVAQVALGKAKVKEAVEKLKALEVSLSYTKIYAPISGYVSQVTTQEGETVVAGLSAVNLITVIDATKLEMWIYVDETDIGRVKPGMKVEYWVDAYRDKRFSGTISLIYPQPEIKENIVYYLAILKIDPKDTTFLKPGNDHSRQDHHR